MGVGGSHQVDVGHQLTLRLDLGNWRLLTPPILEVYILPPVPMVRVIFKDIALREQFVLSSCEQYTGLNLIKAPK